MSVQVTRPTLGPSPTGRAGLAAQLRTSTRPAHVAAELAFDLDLSLAGQDAYRALLLDLQGFYLPVERALAAVEGWDLLTPPVDVAAHSRGDLLARDLRRLAPAAGARRAGPGPRSTDLPLGSLARGLGALYVLAGSALGGRVIAHRARTALGDDLPVGFFSGAGGRAPHQTWRALQASLDAFGGAVGAAGRQQVVRAANETFGALTERLDVSRRAR